MRRLCEAFDCGCQCADILVDIGVGGDGIVCVSEEGLDWENDPMGALDAWYASGAIGDDEYNTMREAFEQYQQEQGNAAGRQYSISEIDGQKEHYGQGVILDTDIFDGVRPRAWGDVLSAYVYNNLAGTELTVYDESGNSETIYLAKATDRVRKDGAKNSHKVLDKLAGYRGDGVRAKAIVQMPEVLAASKRENTTDEHSHQWLDENGWILRKVYLQTRDGDIYEATLNIADGRERKILYDISKVHWIDKKETSASIPSTDNSQRSRYQEPGMGGAQSEVYGDSVSNADQKVKGNKSQKYSISKEAASKKDVAGDLRAILKRGGSASELRQYVAQLERYSGKAEQKATSAEQTRGEAEQILKNAKRQGIGVEEYLRQNWEQYDQDGQWNADARKALELEKKAGSQFSLSGDTNGNALHEGSITQRDVEILRLAGRKSINEFSSHEINNAQKWAQKFYVAMHEKSPFFRAWFCEWRENSTDRVTEVAARPDATLQNGRAKNRDTGIEMSWNAHDVIRETGMHAAREKASKEAVNQLPEIVENAVLLDTVVSMPTSGSKMKNTAFMHSFYSVYDTGSEIHLLKLYAEMALNNKGDTVFTRAYQLKDIKKVAVLGDGVSGANAPLSGANTTTIHSISDLVAVVKRFDPEYKPNPASKIVNDDSINAVCMKASEKAALWQLMTGASSAKNNLYSAEIGQKVINAIAAAK